MNRTPYTGDLADLKGKVIESIQSISVDEDELLIVFTDGQYLLFVAGHTGYDGDLTIRRQDGASDYRQLIFGWITREEYDRRAGEEQAVLQERYRQNDLATLARLKAEYEGGTRE